MEMDCDDWVLVTMIILLFLTIIIGATYNIIDKNLDAEASDKADKICKNQGYDTYDYFKTKLFSSTPLGVKCKYIESHNNVNLNITKKGVK